MSFIDYALIYAPLLGLPTYTIARVGYKLAKRKVRESTAEATNDPPNLVCHLNSVRNFAAMHGARPRIPYQTDLRQVYFPDCPHMRARRAEQHALELVEKRKADEIAERNDRLSYLQRKADNLPRERGGVIIEVETRKFKAKGQIDFGKREGYESVFDSPHYPGYGATGLRVASVYPSPYRRNRWNRRTGGGTGYL